MKKKQTGSNAAMVYSGDIQEGPHRGIQFVFTGLANLRRSNSVHENSK